MQRSKNPTLRDVAFEAGVSPMTVSVVLNGARSTAGVSAVVRERVQNAAERLGYQRNAVARALQKRRMDVLGVVAIVDGGEFNLYFLEVLNGILQAATRLGKNTTVFSLPSWENKENTVLGFCDGRVDGLILLAPMMSAEFAQAHRDRLRIPLVTIHSNVILPGIPNLRTDDEAGAQMAVNHLIALGHRRIAHLGGSMAMTGARERAIGYRRALEETGIPYDESLFIPCGFSRHAGHWAVGEMLRQRGDAPFPTAFFCGNDAIANGCLEALTEIGLRVPQDVSIVGFDDALDARLAKPALTTIRQPLRLLGERATELLVAQTDDTAAASVPVEDVGQEILFPLELVERDSTACLRP